jgi:hypothetical protein
MVVEVFQKYIKYSTFTYYYCRCNNQSRRPKSFEFWRQKIWVTLLSKMVTKNGTGDVTVNASTVKFNINMILTFSPETLRYEKTPTRSSGRRHHCIFALTTDVESGGIRRTFISFSTINAVIHLGFYCFEVIFLGLWSDHTKMPFI